MRISAFLLDDDDNFRTLTGLRLKSWLEDIDLNEARDIASGKDFLDNTDKKITLAILDQHLPDGYGSSLAQHPALKNAAILAVSSDDAPELPAKSVSFGAQHFLAKTQVKEGLFIPMIKALIERKIFEKELLRSQIQKTKMESMKMLLSTLNHEINNPLGAVLGGAYLFKASENLDEKQKEALRLIESSGNRIKHVMKQLCEAADLQVVKKGNEDVFQVPGDPEWKK